MDRSLPFWTEVVGLHVTLDTEEQLTVGGEVVRRRGVYLREREGPDETFVVLDQALSRAPSGEPTKLFALGIHHIGFWVDDLDAIAARARSAGVEIVAEASERGADTTTVGEPPGGFVRSMFVRDPAAGHGIPWRGPTAMVTPSTIWRRESSHPTTWLR